MDIAEIGFKVETSDLEKAVLSLNKVKAAASGVSGATNKVDKAVTSASLSVARAKTAEAQSILKNLQATEKASKGDLNKAAAALRVAKAEEAKAKSLYSSAIAAEKLAKSTLIAIDAEKRQGLTRNQVSLAAGGIANDNLPNRFNTANIAAQFQDIGVTAAMGMNPLTIALQQGTQLSAILNSMQNPLKGLAAAFTSVINPVSLMSIGIIALVVSLIQMVDWAKFAKSSLYAMADAVKVIGPYAIAAAAGLAVLYASPIILGLLTVTKVIYGIGAAIVAAALSPAVLIAALAAAVGVFVSWAVNASKPFRTFANVVIGIFAGLGNMILGQIVDILEAANNLVGMGLNKLIDTFNDNLDKLPAALKKKLNIEPIEFKFKETSAGKEQMEKGAKQLADAFKTTFTNEFKGTDYVGNIGKSIDKGMVAVSSKLRSMAAGIGKDKDSKKDPWIELTKGAEKTIATLKAEQDAFGMTAQAAATLKYETELLNEAKQKDIKLSPEQIDWIHKHAVAMGTMSSATADFKDKIEFAKSTTGSFLKDMASGLREGKSMWESFGNAAVNVMNKVIDKMIDLAVNAAFSGIKFGSFGFGSGSTNAPLAMGPQVASANGNVFNSQGLSKFAKGGTFTNSVVNKPTGFAFANGGSFGVMGEAGPEAVMPLKRGPDGSLGVQMQGSNSGSTGNVIININNNTKASATTQQRQTSQGLEIDVMIDEVVSEKLIKQGTATNRSVNAYNSRQLIKRG